ncbi:hypothetical protein DFS34DRAFT_608771 [Phlyctochytrium arcticum]|nr:hypothetical protein DFS34DRAFT_608771 [Phlyctochytrium arcticum]
MAMRMCHDCGLLEEHYLESFLQHNAHAQRCQCTSHRCNDQGNETAEVVAELRASWDQVTHADHAVRVLADSYGISFPSAAWSWPGLSPCCLTAVDFQHAVGEGEVNKEWRQFSNALVLEYGEEAFWSQFDTKYQEFSTRPCNRVSQPRIPGWNHWRLGPTHENKLTFIVRSIAIVRSFIEDN